MTRYQVKVTRTTEDHYEVEMPNDMDPDGNEDDYDEIFEAAVEGEDSVFHDEWTEDAEIKEIT